MSESGAQPMLELVGVTAGYGRSMVLFDVDLSVPKGGAASVMGHNGAGKTTLLRVAVGLLPVRSGRVLLDGEDVTRERPNRRVKRGLGYVPQGQLCFPQMTTLENLQLVSGVKSEIDEVLDTFPALTTLLGKRAGLLSGGQRQQLAIARTLLSQPRLLILDEPTEGIQPNVVAEIEQVIAGLTRRGDLAVLLVEQHVGFALRATDQYYVLESGRMTGRGRGGEESLHEVRAAMAV
jgi:urea transport system ATP-binding protein